MGTKPITPEIAGDWLVAMGWQTRRYEVDACPDCGSIHTGRCNGKPVAAVVTLAPGETVRITNGTKRQRKAYYRPCLSPEIGEVVKEHRLDVEQIMIHYITEERLW